jgi:ABC-type polysaccharide/polyol phosphate export permease
MSNEDRIKNWRARRDAQSTASEAPEPAMPGGESTVIAEDDIHLAPGDSIAKVLEKVLDLLSSVPYKNAADRRRIYDALENDLEQALALCKPIAEEGDYRRRQLRLIVRTVEADIRAGVNVFVASYRPEALEIEDKRLSEALERRTQQRKQQEFREARRRATQEDFAFEIPLQPQEAAEVAVLRQRLTGIHAHQKPGMPGSLSLRLASVIPLLRLQLHVIQGESRIALLWALFGPAVLLSLISSLYFLSGINFVLGMDVPTFSLTGATTWIMFRQIIFRMSTSYVAARGLLNLEPITPLAVALVQGIIFLAIYAGVYAILIGVGYAFGLVSLPVHRLGVAAYVLMMGVGAAATGLLFGSIATRWHYFLRFAPVIERFLEVFSSVFFVSEQLPAQYRQYFLWSPFAHGMQLLRSAYFGTYDSHDASRAYFFTAVILLMVLGIGVERLARTHVQPM